MKLFYHIGKYFLLLSKIFSRPEKLKIYYKRTIDEIQLIGIDSLGLVIIVSVFIGAVITLQTGYNLENPLIPAYLIGLTARDSMILEFSSTVVGFILAGKVGSNIASEIGTMRVTEQIDALEIMGVNSASYLILPKTIAFVFIYPFLTIISIFVGILGGWFVSLFSDVITPHDYIFGIHYAFTPFYITYTLIKAMVFAFIITSVSAYYGYYTTGGALEVGRASTRAVVYCNILILVFNLILTQLLLA